MKSKNMYMRELIAWIVIADSMLAIIIGISISIG